MLPRKCVQGSAKLSPLDQSVSLHMISHGN